MKKRIVKKVQTLKAIRPNHEWTASTRRVLLSQIQSQGAPLAVPGTIAGLQAYAKDIFGHFQRYFLTPATSHSGAIASVALSLVFGGAVAHIAAQGSLPGDKLYSVKKTSEELQLVLAPANERTVLYLSQAEKRLQELDTIASQPISDQEKATKIDSLAQDVEQTITNVKTNLESVKSSSQTKDAVKIASLVEEKSVRYTESLKKAKESIPSQQNSDKVAKAIIKIEEANTQALGVIVGKKDESAVSDNELADKLAQTIKRTESSVAEVNAKVNAAAKEQEEKSSNAQDKATAAKKALKEAQESLEKKDFKVAYDKLAESQQLLDSAQKDIR